MKSLFLLLFFAVRVDEVRSTPELVCINHITFQGVF